MLESARLLALLILAPTADAQCGTAAFSAGAAAVTADCCAAPSPATGSGHRRLQQGCDIPSVCPTSLCATTFAGFFEGCRDELATLPAARSYAALYASCAQLFPPCRY